MDEQDRAKLVTKHRQLSAEYKRKYIDPDKRASLFLFGTVFVVSLICILIGSTFPRLSAVGIGSCSTIIVISLLITFFYYRHLKAKGDRLMHQLEELTEQLKDDPDHD